MIIIVLIIIIVIIRVFIIRLHALTFCKLVPKTPLGMD